MYQIENSWKFMKFKLSRHAKHELQRRAIPMELLKSVLENPQQVIEAALWQKSLLIANGFWGWQNISVASGNSRIC
ncbi:MAG: hypothetical protein M1438_14500 [Deltaproteobacteria bacterium]|nr:hypothetical protein [Deltaproteobacteria bacterium]